MVNPLFDRGRPHSRGGKGHAKRERGKRAGGPVQGLLVALLMEAVLLAIVVGGWEVVHHIR